jgi:hypothetical protein
MTFAKSEIFRSMIRTMSEELEVDIEAAVAAAKA